MTSPFDDRASDWDTPERLARSRLVAQLLRDTIRLDRSMRVIEIGAGTGTLGLELAPDVGSMVLTDPSEGMLEVARRKAAASGYTNVRVLPYDLEGTPLAETPFDLAIAMLVLHHVEDTGRALRSMHDLLKPGGRLVLLDLDAEDGSFHARDDAGDALDADAAGATGDAHAHAGPGDAPAHTDTDARHDGFDQAELASIAQASGFVGVEASSSISIERQGRTYPLILLTGRRA